MMGSIAKIGSFALVAPLVLASSAFGYVTSPGVKVEASEQSQVKGSNTVRPEQKPETSTKPSPKALLNALVANQEKLESIRMFETGPEQKLYKGITLGGRTDGGGVQADIEFVNGGKVTSIVFEDKTYLQGDFTYWKSTSNGTVDKATFEKIRDKWVVKPTQPEHYPNMKDLKGMWGKKRATWVENIGSEVKETEYQGKPALKLHSRTGSGSYFITTRHKPYYVLEAFAAPDASKGTKEITMRFSEHNAVPEVRRPSPESIVTLPLKASQQ